MNGGVLISHPHAAAYAAASAAGLERAGLLSAFVTGVAAVPGTLGGAVLRGASRYSPRLLNRDLAGVEARHLRALWPVELGARLVGGFAPERGRWKPYDALFVAHDRVVAALPWPTEVRSVYAYEDGALATFRRARKAGLEAIWDLPIPHHSVLADMWREEARRWPEERSAVWMEPAWKIRRKDAELELATRVVVASGFTRASLEKAGCRLPVDVVPYGFPVDDFAQRTAPPAGPFTVLAVGSHDLRKGTPYLLEAWRLAGIPGARLRLVGPMRLSPSLLSRYRGLYEHVPHVPRSELSREYASADLLAFPTLGDGFGMVIQEAMCCGVPVVTTPCGGGPECIDHGVHGYLVEPRNIEQLVEVLRRAERSRERLVELGHRAADRARRYTWAHAGARLAATLRS